MSINTLNPLRDALTYLQAKYTEKHYAVKAGYVLKRFDGARADKPPFPLLTLTDALAECMHAERIGDTLGIDATLYDVRAHEEVYNWRAFMVEQKLSKPVIESYSKKHNPSFPPNVDYYLEQEAKL